MLHKVNSLLLCLPEVKESGKKNVRKSGNILLPENADIFRNSESEDIEILDSEP